MSVGIAMSGLLCDDSMISRARENDVKRERLHGSAAVVVDVDVDVDETQRK